MPIVELRESLGSFDVEFTDDQDRVQMLTKRINLKEGNHERNMLQMDLFFDDIPHELGGSLPQSFPGVIEFFVSPTPLILTNESLQLTPNRGPDASNTNVLYKSILYSATNPQSGPITRFPQDFLATSANFPFYHNQLYLTLVFHAYDDGRFS